MRLVLGSIASLALVVLAVACTTVSADECWPNTSGGFGGSETLPIGAAVGAGSGDFASPPAGGPLDYGGVANPCIEPLDTCNQTCESTYSSVAAVCGKIEIEAQRTACQDAAYAAYKSCREFCQTTNGDDCLEHCKEKCDAVMEKCFKDCPKGDGKCMRECNEEYGRCLKECKKRCK